jgi:hypothetical protein
MVSENPRPMVLLEQWAAAAIEAKVRLHCELVGLSKADQVRLLLEVGGFIADKLERLR